MPKRRRIFFEFPFIIIIVLFFLSFIVMILWNFIFPSTLHAERITYWQAVGLLILCRILFFRFNRKPGDRKPHMWRNNPAWRQKWMNMSDEERAKFREEWKNRCRPNDE